MRRQNMGHILATCPDTVPERLTEALRKVRTGPLEETVRTIAERPRHEGLRAGEILAREMGKTESFTQLPVRRFGSLPDEGAVRIEVVGSEQPEHWSEAPVIHPGSRRRATTTAPTESHACDDQDRSGKPQPSW